MLENIVGRILRSAARSAQSHWSSPKMDTKGSSPCEDVGTLNIAQIEIDNSAAVLNNIEALFTEKILSDVCLVVGGREYPAHRLILCASSEVFRVLYKVMLMNPLWSECSESRIVLGEAPACAEVFDRFLQYFYTGRICVDSHIVMPILTLADKYNIEDLARICEDYMYEHVQNAAITGQLVAWHHYTETCGHTRVAKVCRDFIKWNLQLIATTPDFGNFEPEILISILQEDDLVVVDEMTLLEYVICWINLHREALLAEEGYDDEDDDNINDVSFFPFKSVNDQIEELVVRVITHIRFPMMSPSQLASLLIQPIVQQYKEFFVQRMAIAMSYHHDQGDRIEGVCVNDEAGISLFTPRLYTSENWSMLLLVENYSSLPSYQFCTHVFSSQCAFAGHKGNKTCEWVVDIYPKGVWFQKYFMIVWEGMEEVPEAVLRTVRVSITCKDPPSNDTMCVKVGILVHGVMNGVEHVMRTVVRTHSFHSDRTVSILDDVVSFDKLNRDFVSSNGHSPSCSRSTQSSSTNAHTQPSPYLVGPNRNTLKIHVVIVPIEQVCRPSLLLRRKHPNSKAKR